MIHADVPLMLEGIDAFVFSSLTRVGWFGGLLNGSRSCLRPRSGGRADTERQLLTDRPSRPRTWPARLSVCRERRIVSLRFTRRWGPHRIGYHLAIPRSTLGRVLARYRMPLLHHFDQVTGLPVRGPKPVRYQEQSPGERVHVDIKKLARIPNSGELRIPSQQAGNRNNKKQDLDYSVSAPHRRQLHPTRLPRATRRPTRRDRGSILGPYQGVLRRAGHHHHHRDSRQQLSLSIQNILRHAG